jgi:hypothetical protein
MVVVSTESATRPVSSAASSSASKLDDGASVAQRSSERLAIINSTPKPTPSISSVTGASSSLSRASQQRRRSVARSSNLSRSRNDHYDVNAGVFNLERSAVVTLTAAC